MTACRVRIAAQPCPENACPPARPGCGASSAARTGIRLRLRLLAGALAVMMALPVATGFSRSALAGSGRSAPASASPPQITLTPPADYKAALERLLEGHKRIAAGNADVLAAEAGIAQARGGWYPDLKATANTGYEQQYREKESVTSRLHPRNVGVSVSQTVFDFGRTAAAVEKAGHTHRQSSASVEQARQDVLMEGIAAFINLYRAARSLTYARQSVENIQRQTGLEESRVDLGGGLPTDVLQAKSQLAGAQARLVRAEGALTNASNRYRAVFNEPPPLLTSLRMIPLPQDALPKTLDAALAIALDNNPKLRAMRSGVEAARAEANRVESGELFPRVAAIAEGALREDYSGTPRSRREGLVRLEVTYPFNLGLAAHHAVSAARQSARAAENRHDDARDGVEEQVRNAWQNLITARDNAGFLANQARIAAEFLRLAREERVQGSRSLIDVLSGETALINAQSDAATAEADVSLAGFSLLNSMGRLSLLTVP